MARIFSDKQILQMKRAYLRTMSCAMAAKISGCNRSTIARYRDAQGWVGVKEPVNIGGLGGTTLTGDIAIKLAAGWRVQIQDNKLCPIVGITPAQLKHWLYCNTQVAVVWTIKAPDGTESKRPEVIGLRNLREREWANFEYGLLQEQMNLKRKAEEAGDYKTAASIGQWLLSKRNPKEFGDTKGVAVSVDVQTNIVSADELELPLETCKQILCRIREHKQLKGAEDETP